MPELTPESFEPPSSENVTPNQQANNDKLVEKGDFKSLESTLNEIQQALDNKQFQGNLPLSISIGRTNVFKAVPGVEPTVNKITPDQVELLQKALQDPQGIQGSVRVYIGNEKVFHVNNGQVIANQLNLPSAQLARSQEAPQQSVEAKATQSQPSPSPQSQPQPPQAATPSLQDQVTALQATIEQQQKQLETLNQKLDQFDKSPVLVVVANEKLNNWLSNIRSKVQAAGSEAVVQVSNKLEQNKASLFSKVQQLFSTAKENVADTIHATRDRVNAKASEVVLGAMTAATAKLASTIGEKMPDGSVVVESRSRNQQLEVNGNSVALKERPQLDAQALWDKYSHGVPQDSPPKRTQMVAQNAIRDGITKTVVEDMLKVDPQFQKVQQQQGLGKAQDYAKQMARSAIRREQPVKQQEQQQRNRNQSQNNGLQR